MQHSPELAVLHSNLPSLKPEEKLFLVLLLALLKPSADGSGEWRVFECSSVEAGQKLGFSKEASLKSIKKLREAGMVKEVLEQGLIGRPKKYWAINPGSWQDEASLYELRRSVMGPICVRAIQARLHKPAQAVLKNSLLMLALALLSKADSSGIVVSSHDELRRITGIPKSQVARRLEQLRGAHFLADSVPGLVDGEFLGHVRSVHYINLKHALFKETGVFTEDFTFSTRSIPEMEQLCLSLPNSNWNDRLSSATQAYTGDVTFKNTRISPGSWKENAMAAIERPASKNYIQSAIERYAANLLDEPNSLMTYSQWRNQTDSARTEFVGLLLGTTRPPSRSRDPETQMFYQLCTDLEELSHELAIKCYRQIKPIKQPSAYSNFTSYRILPSGANTRSKIRLERITRSYY